MRRSDLKLHTLTFYGRQPLRIGEIVLQLFVSGKSCNMCLRIHIFSFFLHDCNGTTFLLDMIKSEENPWTKLTLLNLLFYKVEYRI